MLKLSQELVDLIIDDLDADGDNVALKMCSLVCASFCHPSQARIFRRVTLEPWVTNEKTMSFLFHRMITQSPHITRHIRTLVIQDRALHTLPGVMGMRAWVIREPILPLLLQMLQNLERIHFHTQFRWSSLWSNPSLQSAILDVLHSSKIVSVHFRGMDIPASCISQSPGLQRILLNDLTVLDDPDLNAVQSPIRSLGLSGNTLNWFTGIKCPIEMKGQGESAAVPLQLPQTAAAKFEIAAGSGNTAAA
ncbi:hypothetical protein FB451DRAFT_1447215 [Mycena latifolia]|nr:hypothetical protein FB451DRAFT_1447215 [Mycena latifolia]